MISSSQLASALAPLGPPAVAVLFTASATTCGSSWASAGATAIIATASIAASIINFFILPLLLMIVFPPEADPLR
jgi:hypothetical protein